MPNRRNLAQSARLQVTTTPEVVECLEAIARTGLYGKSRAEIADRLVSEGIRRLIGDGIIESPRGRAGSLRKRRRRKRGG